MHDNSRACHRTGTALKSQGRVVPNTVPKAPLNWTWVCQFEGNFVEYTTEHERSWWDWLY
jgi:hypothetical protein